MNEKDVLKQSVKVFIGGLIIFSIVGFVLKQISFMLAIKFDDIFNLISVFFGYFVTKITINILGYIKR